jgi:hypothetical protein
LKANYEGYLKDIAEEISEVCTLLEVRFGGGFAEGGSFPTYGGFPEGGGFAGGGEGRHPGFSRSESFLNESLMLKIEALEGTDTTIPFFEKTEGTNQTPQTPFGTSIEMLIPDYTIVGVVLDNEIINYCNVFSNKILEGRNQYKDLLVLSTDAPQRKYSPLDMVGSMNGGIISALNQTLVTEEYMINNVIQTIAPINPGNSEVPLLNYQGQVVGIVTAVIQDSPRNRICNPFRHNPRGN